MTIDFDAEIVAHLEQVRRLQKPQFHKLLYLADGPEKVFVQINQKEKEGQRKSS